MFDYKLKFESEEQALELVPTYVQGLGPADVVVVTLGILYEDIEGEEVAIAGWHVDIRSRQPLDIPSVVVKTPTVKHHRFYS